MSRTRYQQLDAIAEYVTVGYVGPSSEYFCEGGVPFLRTGNVGTRQIIWSNLKHVTPLFHRKQKKSALQTGDVVISRVISDEVNAAVIPNQLDGANCGNVLVVRPGPRLHPEFLVQLIGCPASQRTLLRRQVGSAQAVINTSVLKAWEIPVLALSEQRRIAEVLDRAEALRAKRRAALAQLDSLTQSLFLDLFGDPATNPKGWPTAAMAELFAASPIFGTMIPPSADGGTWLSLRVGNIQDWQLDLTDSKFVDLPSHTIERHSVKDGDLLLARAIASQEHLGKAVVANPAGRKWAFDSHLMRLRFDQSKADPEVIRHLLMTPGGRSLFLKAARRSAVQFNINTKEMSALRVPLPPIALQRDFARRVAAVERLRAAQRASLAELDALFACLQHRAFRGEL